MRLRSEELGHSPQTPTLIGCMFLRNQQNLSRFARLAAISEAFDYHTFLEDLSTSGVFADLAISSTTPLNPNSSVAFSNRLVSAEPAIMTRF
ncbi:hypothetical protein ACA040_000801 [Xenophilus aerolatus]